MAAGVVSVLLLLLNGPVLLGLSVGTGQSSPGSHPDSERGMLELQRVRSFAAQPRYGECWARALEHLDTRCRDMTSEIQSRIALRFAHCHLSSSGRGFPSCPEGSEVSRCTGAMDAVAFNTYTEFFTQTYSMCHFLQSEAWQHRTENTMHRLTDASAGVVQQLESTRQMAEDLMEAQNAALQAQQEILSNGEELRATLRDSTQGLRSIFSELSSVSQQQQVALSELFNRVSFLQSFLLMEAHSLSSCCYNAAALCCAFLLTCTQRTCRARLLLLSLVCLNFYLEKRIYQFVMNSDQPEDRHLELLSIYIGVLRRFMLCVAAFILLVAYVRYRDPLQQSLQLLQQLQETQTSLQEALQRAESLGQKKKMEDKRLQVKVSQIKQKSELRRRVEELRKKTEEQREQEEEESAPTDHCHLSHLSHLSHTGCSFVVSRTLNSSAADPTDTQISHDASVQRPCRPSPLMYSVLVEETKLHLHHVQPRYSLRSRKSETRS